MLHSIRTLFLELQWRIKHHSSKISHRCAIMLSYGWRECHNLGFTSFLCLSINQQVFMLCRWGIVVLQETTSIRIEMFIIELFVNVFCITDYVLLRWTQTTPMFSKF